MSTVLDGAKASQTNSPQSEMPSSGVARDFKPCPAALAAISPAVVDLHGSQYAASFLGDVGTQTEYALWAANTAQVALVPLTTTDANTPGVVVGTGLVPQGSLPVSGGFTDGADYLGVRDTQGRAAGSILSVLFVTGTGSYFLLSGAGVTPPVVNLTDAQGNPIAVTPVANAFSYVDPQGGIVGLTSSALTALGGGASQERGDQVLSSYLVLANQTFWWSKNDAQTIRFDFEGKTQKWQPIKGGSVQDVGVLTASASYRLAPPPRNFDIGDYLSGSTNPDQYATLRVGTAPSAVSSTPLAYIAVPAPAQYFGVRVVADADVAGFQFTGTDT